MASTQNPRLRTRPVSSWSRPRPQPKYIRQHHGQEQGQDLYYQGQGCERPYAEGALIPMPYPWGTVLQRRPQLRWIQHVHVYVYVCAARITILASRLAAGVVNFDSADDIVITAAIAGAPVSSTQAVLRVVRGSGVYGIVNVAFQVTILGTSSTDAVVHITPSSGVVSFLDRQVSNT